MRLALLFLVAAVAALQSQTFPSPYTIQPRVIHKVDPEYTQEARDAKLEGSVILAAVVSIDGTAADIKVVKGLGKGLDEKAVECLMQWRFQPATRDGNPVPVKAAIEINFRLH